MKYGNAVALQIGWAGTMAVCFMPPGATPSPRAAVPAADFPAAGVDTAASGLAAQKMINIIPTPKTVAVTGGAVDIHSPQGQAVIVLPDAPSAGAIAAAEYLRDALHAELLIDLPVKRAGELGDEAGRAASLVFMDGAAGEAATRLAPAAAARVRASLKGLGHPEGYALTAAREGDRGIVVIAGVGAPGLLHGAASLAQAVQRRGDACFCPCMELADYPDYDLRWAYRVSPENTLRYKCNLAPYLTFYGNFRPDYTGGLTRNRAGRRLGVAPVIGFFGSTDLLNRRAYPAGGLYPCIGDDRGICEEGYYQTYKGQSRVQGFCLSNEQLLALKCDRLREFTANNEPMCLYLHFEDTDAYAQSVIEWKNRCDACRDRYPNDRIEAQDGKAAAMARTADAMCAAVFSVKKPDGYDAARDCRILLVLSPYMRWSESDDSFAREVRYYVNVSRNMTQVPHVSFVIREIGPGGAAGAGFRMRVLADALRDEGRGHNVFVYCHGGDARTAFRRWPRRHAVNFHWSASPLTLQSFEGASGAFIQAASRESAELKAECLWNRKSPLIEFGMPADKAAWGSVFAGLIGGALPAAVFGPGEFFDRAFQNRYGARAGAMIADALRPEMWRKSAMFPEPGAAWLQHVDKVWSFRDVAAMQAQWRELFEKIRERNDGAIRALQAAPGMDDFRRGRAAELADMAARYREGRFWAGAAAREAEVYRAMWSGAAEDTERADAIWDEWLSGAPAGTEQMVETRRKRIADARTKLEDVRLASAGLKSRLALLKGEAPRVAGEIERELSVRADYDLPAMAGRLEVMRFGVMGDRGQWPAALARQNMVRHISSLNDNPAEHFDVLVILPDAGLGQSSSNGMEALRDFVSAGRGLLLVGSAPYRLAGGSDLSGMADWLGALRYGNSGAGVAAVRGNFISDGSQSWIERWPGNRGAAGLAAPLTGVPLLAYRDHPDLFFMLANKFGAGRVLYAARADIPEDMLLRMLLWLAYNKI